MRELLDWSAIYQKTLTKFLEEISEDEFRHLLPFFEKRTAKPRGVLLKSGSIEIESRVVLDGIIGKFYLGDLKRLYFKGDICVDLDSFTSHQASKFELKVLQEVKYFSLSYTNAKIVLNMFPKLIALNKELHRIIRHQEDEWEVLLQSPYIEARKELNRRYPGFEAYLSQKQLAALLGVAPKTISRSNSLELAKARNSKIIRNYKENLKYPFVSKIHPQVESIDELATVWGATIHRIFTGTKDENRYKKLQLTWLVARLFPEADQLRFAWLAKFYALLFAMNDFTDQLPFGLKEEIWKEISKAIVGVFENNICLVLSKSIMAYRNAFYDLWQKLPDLVQGHQEYLDFIQDEIRLYLESNVWKARNIDLELIPDLEEYRRQRSYFSGSELTLSLIPLGMDCPLETLKLPFEKTQEIRSLANKLIYLSDDLFSFEKERGLVDFHNLLRLCVHHEKLNEEDAREMIIREHKKTLQQFMDLAAWFENSKEPVYREIVKQIQYKLSGAASWTLFDTNRHLKLLEEN